MRIPSYLILLPLALLLASCGAVHNRFLRADVVTFGSTVNTNFESAPYDLTQPAEAALMHQFIADSVPEGGHSAVFYAMEQAAERVQYVRKNLSDGDPETRYYIFLLTNGFDNASPQAAKNDGRIRRLMTYDKYGQRVRQALAKAMGPFDRNTFEVYPLILKGDELSEMQRRSNLSDDEFLAYLNTQLACLRYSSKGKDKAPSVICYDNLQDIYNAVFQQVIHSTYRFRVPTAYVKKRIKMNFRNRQGQQASVTGVLKKKGGDYVLDNVQLDSMTVSAKSRYINRRATCLTALPSEDPNDLSVGFILEDIRDLNGLPFIPDPHRVDQEVLMSGNLWYINPDFADTNELDVNTYFIFVVDGDLDPTLLHNLLDDLILHRR